MSEIAAKIGPNAIIQLGETFAARHKLAEAAEIYAAAECLPLLKHPPLAMVDESIVAQLFTAVTSQMKEIDAESCLSEAGSRTGEYILANRIPVFARVLLPLLPSSIALRLLLKAIQKHSWTFAGSGQFSYATKGTPQISISNNQIATTLGCVWHEAVFTKIFCRLLGSPVVAKETACCGRGATACRFEIHIES